MKLQTVDFPFRILTPTFCGGADNQAPAELRPPSIRGQVRFWHRVLFGDASRDAVWGSSAGNGTGSKVALVLDRPFAKGETKERLLPHCDANSTDKQEKKKAESRRSAVSAGLRFNLTLQRLVSCSNDDWEGAQKAVKLWLLLGTLGLRSTRAAGSVWPEGDWVPQTPDALKATLHSLGLTQWGVALVGLSVGKGTEDLRKTASDTISGNPHRHIFGGIHPQRTPSPTKFKAIGLGAQFCLLACAPSAAILREAERLLLAKREPRQRWKVLGSWRHLLP